MDPSNVGYTEDTNNLTQISGCIATTEQWYPSYFGIKLAIPEWEAIITAIILTVIIVLTIIGNVLVILSVFTYKPLRIVQNFFIVSLAVADLTVAILVLPFNVAYAILGRWEFGIYLCKMWLTCDVMCCTSSILNLCAIALDRYWAITDPINYAQKRTVGRVLLLIAGVWLLSLLISSPPLVGWNDWPDEFTSATPCELNSDPGYVIYSALGSFYIPLVIMTMVYLEIFIATRRRLRKRAQVSKLHAAVPPSLSVNTVNRSTNANSKFNNIPSIPSIYRSSLCCNKQPESALQNDHDSVSSELHVNNDKVPRNSSNDKQMGKLGRFKIKDSLKIEKTYACAAGNTIDDDGSKSMQENSDTVKQEMSTESASDPKEEIEDCTGIINVVANIDDENISIKMPSSNERMSVQTIPVEPKPVAIHQFIEEKQKISLSKERRAARTLGIIMGVFVICWLPFFLMYVILPFCSSCCPTSRFKNFITWLGYINSVLNPIIYTIFNLDYRRAFKSLLGFNK